LLLKDLKKLVLDETLSISLDGKEKLLFGIFLKKKHPM
jgi:hypothetical protein